MTNAEAFDEADNFDECFEASTATEKDYKRTTESMDHSYCYGGTDGVQGVYQGLWRFNPWKQIEIVLYRVQLLVANNDIKKDQEDKDVCDAAKASHLKPTWCSMSVATVVYPEYTDSLIHHLPTKKISPVVINIYCSY